MDWCLDLDVRAIKYRTVNDVCAFYRFDLLYRVDFSTSRAFLSHSLFHPGVYRLTVLELHTWISQSVCTF